MWVAGTRSLKISPAASRGLHQLTAGLNSSFLEWLLKLSLICDGQDVAQNLAFCKKFLLTLAYTRSL